MENEKIQLKLYLAGISPENQKLILNFKEQLKSEFGEKYTLEVVDVLEHPEIAFDEKILATPTIVKSLPTPIKKFIFDLGDAESVSISLNMIKKNE